MARRGSSSLSITNAAVSHSQELHGRQVRYLLSMLVRTVCFVAAVVTPGPMRWVLIAGAVFLPYVAVILANAGSRRSPGNSTFTTPDPFGVLEAGTSPPEGPPDRSAPPTGPPG